MSVRPSLDEMGTAGEANGPGKEAAQNWFEAAQNWFSGTEPSSAPFSMAFTTAS